MSALPESCVVLGGGRMGSGIAHALLLSGASVTVVEADTDRAAAATARICEALAQSERRTPDAIDAQASAARLRSTTDPNDAAGAGLLIEALPEDLEFKQATLIAYEQLLPASAVLASNTSSLSITALAATLQRPEHFLGMHFFNPVPASALIELVVGEQTSDEVVSAASAWVEFLGKTPIVIRDSPGFASSRLGLALGLEAIRMVQDGVASPEDIDAAMTLGYKHPVGPLKLTDLVGLDVRMDIATYLHQTLGERFAVPPLMREMVERGDLGRKSGRGFYDWQTEGSRS